MHVLETEGSVNTIVLTPSCQTHVLGSGGACGLQLLPEDGFVVRDGDGAISVLGHIETNRMIGTLKIFLFMGYR